MSSLRDQTNLNKDGNDGESSDDGAVVRLSGQDVQGPDGSLDNLLHPDAVGVRPGRLATAGALETSKNFYNIDHRRQHG